MRKTLVSAVLCVSLLCLSFESFAATFAIDNNAANAHRRIAKTRKYKKTKKYRKYRQWLRYRARLDRQRRMRARRYHAQRRVRPARRAARAFVPKAAELPVFPFAQQVPAGWRRVSSNGSEAVFSLDDGVGAAVISVVGPASGETVDTGRHRKIGGVPTTALRRQVIDRMVREQGWIVNDYQKLIGGRSVFVVVAESPAKNGGTHSRMYYFTEADGRIYSVATSSPLHTAERIAAESALVIGAMAPSQRAAVRE